LIDVAKNSIAQIDHRTRVTGDVSEAIEGESSSIAAGIARFESSE
jgi:hypothetical protein